MSDKKTVNNKTVIVLILVTICVSVTCCLGFVFLGEDSGETSTPSALNSEENISTIVAGTAYSASTQTMLANPPTLTQVPEILETSTFLPPSTLSPTITLTPTNTVSAITPLPSPSPVAVCNCSGDLYNCSDFGSQTEAQACFNYCKPGDIHKLDQNEDGIPCESLP